MVGGRCRVVKFRNFRACRLGSRVGQGRAEAQLDLGTWREWLACVVVSRATSSSSGCEVCKVGGERRREDGTRGHWRTNTGKYTEEKKEPHGSGSASRMLGTGGWALVGLFMLWKSCGGGAARSWYLVKAAKHHCADGQTVRNKVRRVRRRWARRARCWAGRAVGGLQACRKERRWSLGSGRKETRCAEREACRTLHEGVKWGVRAGRKVLGKSRGGGS